MGGRSTYRAPPHEGSAGRWVRQKIDLVRTAFGEISYMEPSDTDVGVKACVPSGNPRI